LSWIRFELGGAEMLFSDRTGGVSAPPFDTANVGFGRGDDPDRVAENRRRVGSALGGRAADPATWTCLHQVHGTDVVAADGPSGFRGCPPKSPPGGATNGAGPPADAVVTGDPEAVLAILTADCGPVALIAPGASGAVHAGWRGVAAGVLQAATAKVQERARGAVRAVIGPCVRPCCYEFSPADLAPVAARFGREVAARTRGGRLALDLPRAITIALRAAGVADVTDLGVCTACSEDHFSYRRDGRTGLQAMLLVGTG
jgi:polyphenol oxidase